MSKEKFENSLGGVIVKSKRILSLALIMTFAVSCIALSSTATVMAVVNIDEILYVADLPQWEDASNVTVSLANPTPPNKPDTPSGGTSNSVKAGYTTSKVYVDGKLVNFDAYNIGGSNYFNLRDIAYAINGTSKQFEVTWDSTNNAINLLKGKPYAPAGGELETKGSGAKQATSTNSKILLDSKEVKLTAYNIDGNNYFKLRDIGEILNFNVSWDSVNNAIMMNTSESYTLAANLTASPSADKVKPNNPVIKIESTFRVPDGNRNEDTSIAESVDGFNITFRGNQDTLDLNDVTDIILTVNGVDHTASIRDSIIRTHVPEQKETHDGVESIIEEQTDFWLEFTTWFYEKPGSYVVSCQYRGEQLQQKQPSIWNADGSWDID